MPKIDDLSIFGEYGQAENRLTVALLQILKTGGEPLVRHFAEGLGFNIPSSEIDILSQPKGRNCTPDGLLESTFSFSLVIESKIKKNAVNRKQLAALLEDQAERSPDTTLLYLTPDKSRPKALEDEACIWANWIKVRDVLRGYLDKTDIDNQELLEFLIEEFDTFAGNLGTLADWTLDASRVLVVPARNARGVAREFGVYKCQNRRTFQPCGWIAFYAHGEIDTLAEIAAAPEDDVIIAARPELAKLARITANPQEPCRLIRLKEPETVGPIKNDLKDKSGKATAWVQNQRYTTIDRIEKAKVTSEL